MAEVAVATWVVTLPWNEAQGYNLYFQRCHCSLEAVNRDSEYKNIKNKNHRRLAKTSRDGSVVKRDVPDSSPSIQHIGWLKLLLTPDPGKQAPSSGLRPPAFMCTLSHSDTNFKMNLFFLRKATNISLYIPG